MGENQLLNHLLPRIHPTQCFKSRLIRNPDIHQYSTLAKHQAEIAQVGKKKEGRKEDLDVVKGYDVKYDGNILADIGRIVRFTLTVQVVDVLVNDVKY